MSNFLGWGKYPPTPLEGFHAAGNQSVQNLDPPLIVEDLRKLKDNGISTNAMDEIKDAIEEIDKNCKIIETKRDHLYDDRIDIFLKHLKPLKYQEVE